ncbi:MAG: hypothetical protein H6525_07470 [Actinobacteria bacterium]|nr:hypothetical protein [Actinomycetota bacterium]MCB9412668.1 hypothetical protein [Actinomycetota bacterium]
MSERGSKKKWLGVAFVAVVVLGVALAVAKARQVEVEATAAAEDIEARLNDLDPVTRAAAVGKLAESEV